MSYPDINPIQPGRDGWATTYHDAISRILFHCGLRQCSHGWMVRTCALTPAQAKSTTKHGTMAAQHKVPYYVTRVGEV